ncbi:MAG: hypothetical protein AB7O62_01675 [Pirellulales bacterium]
MIGIVVMYAITMLALPMITHERYMRALQQRDIRAANRLCDKSSFYLDHVESDGSIGFFMRWPETPGFARSALLPDDLAYRLDCDVKRSPLDWVMGRSAAGRSSMFFGHLEVVRGTVRFAPD